jgi:hypothetical protein
MKSTFFVVFKRLPANFGSTATEVSEQLLCPPCTRGSGKGQTDRPFRIVEQHGSHIIINAM